MTPEVLASLICVERIWIEKHDSDPDACDVLVALDDGSIHTATFVTLDSLRRQMELTLQLARSIEDTVPVRFAAMEVPHVLVENLNRDTIEDTVDNLLAMQTFESVFTRVTDNETTTTTTRATQEVAAVVLSQVLQVED